MKTLLRIAAVLIFSLLIAAPSAFSAILSEALEKDIEAIVALVPESEKSYVKEFLTNGPPASGKTFVTAGVAKNSLNILEDDSRITMPLARTMVRLAEGADFARDVREYAFYKLSRLAGKSADVKAIVKPLATELSQRDQDVLKNSASKFLRDEMQPPASAKPRFTSAQLVGQWRYENTARDITTNLTFKADGTFLGNIIMGGTSKGGFAGKWALNGNKLNWEYTASEVRNIPAGARDQDTIIEIAKDHCIIENAAGNQETYVRIK